MNDMQILYCANDPEIVNEIKREPFILNRILSMNESMINICENINKYTQIADSKIIKGLMWLSIPKLYKAPYFELIKKKSIIDDFDFLFEKIKKYFHWSDREIELHKPLFEIMFANGDILRELFQFFGIEKKYYKEFGINFKKQKGWFLNE